MSRTAVTGPDVAADLDRLTALGGSGMELGRWLAPGERLRLQIDGVGVIEHLIGGGA